MHGGEALPRVAPETPMPAVFHEMSAKKLGMTTVTTTDGRLAGILTDGDLRRLMEKHGGATLSMSAGDCMVRGAQTIGPKVLASEVLNLDGEAEDYFGCGGGRGAEGDWGGAFA